MLTSPRPPVETIRGRAAGAVRGIEKDFSLLEAPSEQPAAHAWTCEEVVVVLGVSRDLAVEVDEDECGRRDVAILRRASGGGTVMIGPGTLQYAFALPHAANVDAPSIDVSSISSVKRDCNELVRRALVDVGVGASLKTDSSGDLRVGDRKVGGVALRRRREATLLHGTMLLTADLSLIASVLRHPEREPAWRQGRSHGEFLANLGPIDVSAFEKALRDALNGDLAGR